MHDKHLKWEVFENTKNKFPNNIEFSKTASFSVSLACSIWNQLYRQYSSNVLPVNQKPAVSNGFEPMSSGIALNGYF